MSAAFDVCVIGSGAGGAPVAARAAEAGYRVVVLERGGWYGRDQFLKDEISICRRPHLLPSVRTDPQVWEYDDAAGLTRALRTGALWDGTMVGGASVLMSGYFHRLKPVDFRMRSTYGTIEGADLADWPIDYDELEPWYARAEREVGVSGIAWDVLPDALRDRRSTEDFPFPPTEEHPFADHIDKRCEAMGLHPFPTPRAVLPDRHGSRGTCAYTGYCGSYGCTTGAKGSALEAFIPRAVATGRCEVRTYAQASRLVSDRKGRVVAAEYHNRRGERRTVRAGIFVVACKAIESARLLLASPGPRHRQGLANRSGLVGRNLITSTFGAAWGDFHHDRHPDKPWLRSTRTFVNRTLQDWYFIDDEKLGRRKGGSLNFLLYPRNPIAAGMSLATSDRVPKNGIVWGQALKDRLRSWYLDASHLKCEIFGEWLPHAGSRVTLDPHVKDRHGLPVARVRLDPHPRNRETAHYLLARGVEVLRALGAEDARTIRAYGGASTNLTGGTCRFGDDPALSVLDRDCRAHDAPNLFVTDGSFMPTGGAVPFTFTIYANALRVAERIVQQLDGPR